MNRITTWSNFNMALNLLVATVHNSHHCVFNAMLGTCSRFPCCNTFLLLSESVDHLSANQTAYTPPVSLVTVLDSGFVKYFTLVKVIHKLVWVLHQRCHSPLVLNLYPFICNICSVQNIIHINKTIYPGVGKTCPALCSTLLCKWAVPSRATD